MKHLLSAEFMRLFKSKTLLLTTIIFSAFSVLGVVVLHFIFQDIQVVPDTTPGIITFDPLMSFYATNTLTNYFSDYLTIGIFIALIINLINTKDYSQGTIRNFMVSGESRTTIYLTKAIITSIATIIFIGISIIVVTLASTIVTGWSTTFASIDLLEFLGRSLLVILIYIAFSTIITFFAHLFQSSGKVIAITLVICFVFQILYGLYTYNLYISGGSGSVFLEIITKIFVPVHLAGVTSLGGELNDILFAVLASVLTILLFTILGILKFKQRDLK